MRPGGDDLTRSGTVVGTPDYMAPEQAKNSSTVDHRADLYSLGCTLYFLLAGQPPFPDGNAIEKILKHQIEAPLPLQALRPEVPTVVAEIVARLMARSPADRFATALEAAEALAPLARELVGVVSPPPHEAGRALSDRAPSGPDRSIGDPRRRGVSTSWTTRRTPRTEPIAPYGKLQEGQSVDTSTSRRRASHSGREGQAPAPSSFLLAAKPGRAGRDRMLAGRLRRHSLGGVRSRRARLLPGRVDRQVHRADDLPAVAGVRL